MYNQFLFFCKRPNILKISQTKNVFLKSSYQQVEIELKNWRGHCLTYKRTNRSKYQLLTWSMYPISLPKKRSGFSSSSPSFILDKI